MIDQFLEPVFYNYYRGILFWTWRSTSEQDWNFMWEWEWCLWFYVFLRLVQNSPHKYWSPSPQSASARSKPLGGSRFLTNTCWFPFSPLSPFCPPSRKTHWISFALYINISSILYTPLSSTYIMPAHSTILLSSLISHTRVQPACLYYYIFIFK